VLKKERMLAFQALGNPNVTQQKGKSRAKELVPLAMS
jgi:hypothetical protein